MKKSVKLAALAMMFLTAAMTACTTPSGNGDGGEEFVLGDGSKDNFEITENTTLTYPNTYTLKGFVYVPDGVTLTIEPGVVIKGDKATQGTLIVEPPRRLPASANRATGVVSSCWARRPTTSASRPSRVAYVPNTAVTTRPTTPAC